VAAGASIVILGLVAIIYLGLLILKAGLALRVARHTRISTGSLTADHADVAIMQAILSGDPALTSALEDNLQSLPDAHFIWVVDDDDHAGHALTAMLRQRHAHARIDIVLVPQPPDSVNPKLHKLASARARVTARVVVVLDDDTRMPATTLDALVASLDTAMLSTALPGYLDASTHPSRLLAAFVNNNAAVTYLPMLTAWPAVSINGMAYALETATLDRLGGFGAMTSAVTDDLAMAGRVMAAGGTICQSPEPVWVQTTVASVGHYLRVMHRWYVFALILIANQAASRRLVIAGAYATPPVLLWAAIVPAVLSPSAWHLIVIAAVLAVRSIVLIGLQRRIYGRGVHRHVFSIASELVQPLHLAHALLRRTINWRTRRYRVNLDQTFTNA
jgi:ceramide glucosyltransferase